MGLDQQQCSATALPVICHYNITGRAIAPLLKFMEKANFYAYRNEILKLITKKNVLVQTWC